VKGNAGKGETYFKVPISYFPGETVKSPRQLLAGQSKTEEKQFPFIVARRREQTSALKMLTPPTTDIYANSIQDLGPYFKANGVLVRNKCQRIAAD